MLFLIWASASALSKHLPIPVWDKTSIIILWFYSCSARQVHPKLHNRLWLMESLDNSMSVSVNRTQQLASMDSHVQPWSENIYIMNRILDIAIIFAHVCSSPPTWPSGSPWEMYSICILYFYYIFKKLQLKCKCIAACGLKQSVYLLGKHFYVWHIFHMCHS